MALMLDSTRAIRVDPEPESSLKWLGFIAVTKQRASECPCDFDGLVALEHVPGLDVVVAVDLHAASMPDLTSLASSLKRRLLESAVVFDDDPVTSDTDLGVPLDESVGDVATRDHSDLRDPEDVSDLGMSEDLELEFRSKQARSSLGHVIGDVVDHVVETDVDPPLLGDVTRLRGGGDVEPDDDRAGRLCEHDVALADAADRGVLDGDADLVASDLAEHVPEGLDGSLDVALDHERQLLGPGILHAIECCRA